MTIREVLKKTRSEYKLSPLDAEILLSLALEKPKEYILAHPEKTISPAQCKKYSRFIKRRSAGEPIAYITGKKEFFGLDFSVNKNVLIPRPETETMVEDSLQKISRQGEVSPNRWLDKKCQLPDTVIDVGTGSGNIVISIAKNIPGKIRKKIKFYGVDISKESLRVAKANAEKYKLHKQIKFVRSDLIEYFSKNKITQKNILIVANLPYVSPQNYRANKNNLRFEPKAALLSNDGGLNHYRRLFRQIEELLTKCCETRVTCFVEFSPEQKVEIGRIIKQYLPKSKTSLSKDLARKWRMAKIKITS